MLIRKERVWMVGFSLLSFLLADESRRLVPPIWETGLTPAGFGKFAIRQEGDLTLKTVTARLGTGSLELVPVPSYQGTLTSSVADIAKKFSLETKRPVFAAINGGFFDVSTGLPIGFLLRDGRMEFFNMPQGYTRSMVGFCSPNAASKRSHIWISSPREMPKAWLETVTAGSGRPVQSATLAVHHINVPGGKNAFSLFTPTYASVLKLPEHALYAVAVPEAGRRGVYRISEVKREGRLRLPAQGLVVAMHGDARAQARWVMPGTLIRPKWTLPTDWENHQVTHGLLAGPRLLKGGKLQVTAREEKLDGIKSRDRVALGVKPDGEVLLLWAHRNNSNNLSFEDVAKVLASMGATEAIALDGGKSRAILAESRGAERSAPAMRYFEGGRPVANALVLTGRSTNTHL